MVSEADYMDMIERKSGALAGCAARLGSLAAGAQSGAADALEQWGRKLGMARQVRDDISDLWGRSGDGFTPANILNKKKSLPLIHALQNSDTASKRELGSIYMKRVLEPGDTPSDRRHPGGGRFPGVRQREDESVASGRALRFGGRRCCVAVPGIVGLGGPMGRRTRRQLNLTDDRA